MTHMWMSRGPSKAIASVTCAWNSEAVIAMLASTPIPRAISTKFMTCAGSEKVTHDPQLGHGRAKLGWCVYSRLSPAKNTGRLRSNTSSAAGPIGALAMRCISPWRMAYAPLSITTTQMFRFCTRGAPRQPAAAAPNGSVLFDTVLHLACHCPERLDAVHLYINSSSQLLSRVHICCRHAHS